MRALTLLDIVNAVGLAALVPMLHVLCTCWVHELVGREWG